jgi:signal transduction histidine kinase/CheY-like chemotaxis protein
MGPGREDAVYRKAWQLAGRGRTWTGHLSHRKKDGRRYDVDATITPVREGEDPITNFVVVSLDVTREKQLAEQLRQSQKMDAIGQLAGGIAHDFNNLLTSILGYASLLKLKGELNPTTYQAVDVIETAANRAGDLTQQLLGFARRGKNQSVAVDLHGTIQEVIRLLSHTIDKGISITQRLESSAPVVIGDPNQLEQVLLNLCLNARDAIERRRAEEGPAAEGVISLITESVEAELDNAAGEDGGQVRIRITDTGCGIPREDLSRVFEPFFTTKEKGKGTGMGLAMAYGIIDNHEGSITVESTVGQGTAFTVLLPLARTARPSATREEMGAPIRGQGRLLVVDDEEIVLNTVQDLLLNLGYEVITAGSGEEAVKLYAENWRGIQLVLLDLVMPGMGGDECFSCLKEINPEVRAILSTGYGLNEQAQAVLDEGAVAFISKPYQINNLSSVIFEHLLDGRASH